MKVAVLWWSPVSIGGATQAIRGHVKGFDEAGHDVHLWFREDLEEFGDHADEYDFILTPYIDVGIEASAHVHLQIGGFGDPNLNPVTFQQTVAAADTVTVMDSSLLEYFQELAGLVPASVGIVPNPPNKELFQPQPPEKHDGIVLVPKIGGAYKTGELLVPIAGPTNDIIYEAHAHMEAPSGLPVNVSIMPGVPFSAMPRRYQRAAVVLNPAQRESGPGVAYEAWLSGRPFVCPPSGIGKMKSIPVEILNVDDFGATGDWWIDEYGAFFGAGNDQHYISRQPGDLAPVIRELLSDDEKWHDLVDEGYKWISLFDEWGWKEKAETLIEIKRRYD